MNYLKTTKSAFCVGFLAIFFFMTSCKPQAENELMTIEIAQLLQRGDKIQMGKEWDAVQNEYSNFKHSLEANPNDNETKILLAKLYIKEARITGEHGHYYSGALAILEDALEDKNITNDMKFLALTTKAGVQLSHHDFQEALETGTEALVMNPANAQIYGVLVDANVELGNYDKAVKLMDKMVSIKPDIRSYSRVSYLREIHGDLDGSIEAMTMAVKAGFPGYEETAWAMLTLGDIYQHYDQLDKAENVYNVILETRPDYPFAVGALGEIQMLKGNEEEAEKTLAKAMNIIPEVGFYITMAELYKRQGRQDELDKIMEEIMVMLQEDTESGHNMNLEYASIYLDILENPKMARVYADKEYVKRPNNIDVNRKMAKVYSALGEKVKAKEYLAAAKITGSKHPEIEEIENGLK